MTRRWALLVPLALCLCAPAIAMGDTSFVSSVNLGSAPLRNDFSGAVGMEITVGSTPITATQLCRYYVSGNSGTHTLTLASTSGATLASVPIDMGAGSADSNGFKCAALTHGVSLSPSTSYYVTSSETNGGDQWRDYNLTLTPTSGAGSIPSAVYLYGGSYTLYGSTDNSYGPVDLYYSTGSSGALTGTYYVDNSGSPACSDSYAGTSSSQPWCDFDNVNTSTFGPGAQILLARGDTWYQPMYVFGSGTSSAWITVDAYGSGSLPVIRGNDAASDRTIVGTNLDYWSFSNLEISHAGEGILVDYTTLGHSGLSFDDIYAHDITAIAHRSPQQTDFPNIWNSAAITIGTDTATPDSSQWAISGITIEGLDATNTQGLYVDNGGPLLTVSDYSSYPPNTIQDLVLKNSWLHDMPYPGIAISSTENSYVHSNHIDCSGHVAEAQGTTCDFHWLDTNVVTANNVIANMPDTSSSDESGIDLEGYLDKQAERGNYVYGNAGPGIELLQLAGRSGDYSTNNTISGNTFVDDGIGSGWGDTYVWENSGTGNHAGGTIDDNLTNGVQNGDFGNFSQSNNVSVTAANTYNAAWSFGGTQGGGQWSYQYYDGSSWTNMTTYDSTDNLWSHNSAFIAEMRMQPDSNGASWVCRMWTAPRAGTIQIRGQVFKDELGGDGVGVLIAQNNTVIWPAGGNTYTISADDQDGLSSTLNDVSVQAGDQIRFEVWDGGSNDSTADVASWMPTVSYTG